MSGRTPQAQQASSPESLVGTVIADRYKILEIIGQGGIGVVYKAQHTFMDRIVAFKMLRRETLQDDRSMQRFQLEAKVMTSVSHPNIVSVFDFGIMSNQSAFLVMEFLDGTDLDTLIQAAGYLAPDEVVFIFVQICDALSHLHDKGLIHRDLKPANVIILNPGSDAQVKLVDFGMAKFQEASRQAQSLTRPGEVYGSPYYMSPEQCVGMQLDGRSDIYSMGCVMYEALTGRPPFLGDNMVQLAQMHLDATPQPIGEAIEDRSFPRWLDSIVMKALSKNMQDRYQSAEEMKKALLAFQRTWLQRTTSRLVFTSPTGEFTDSGVNQAVQRDAANRMEQAPQPTSPPQPDPVAEAWKNNLNEPQGETSKPPRTEKSRPPELDYPEGIKPSNNGKKIVVISVLAVFVVGLIAVAFLAGRVSNGSSTERWQKFDTDGTNALEAGKLSEAEYNFMQAAKLAETNGIKDNQPLFESLINLGTVYQREGKLEIAENLYKDTISRIEFAEGKTSGNLAPVLIKLGKLYGEMNRPAEAEAMHQRAKSIVESAFGEDDQRRTKILNEYSKNKKQNNAKGGRK